MKFKMPMNSSSKSVNVLVVGDGAPYISIVSKLLEKCNYQVVTIARPVDALSKLQTNDESFDLAVTDVKKPGIYGFELRQLITQTFYLPVLLMSKTKIIWTESLHNKFLAAIKDIGFDEAKPAKILEHMKVPGLTRRNVSSHLHIK